MMNWSNQNNWAHLPYEKRRAYPLAGDPLDYHEKTVIRLVGEGKTDAEIIDLMDIEKIRAAHSTKSV